LANHRHTSAAESPILYVAVAHRPLRVASTSDISTYTAQATARAIAFAAAL